MEQYHAVNGSCLLFLSPHVLLKYLIWEAAKENGSNIKHCSVVQKDKISHKCLIIYSGCLFNKTSCLDLISSTVLQQNNTNENNLYSFHMSYHKFQ